MVEDEKEEPEGLISRYSNQQKLARSYPNPS
jgi:hypothetical protein